MKLKTDIFLNGKPLCFGSGGCPTCDCPWKVKCVYKWVETTDARIVKLRELARC